MDLVLTGASRGIGRALARALPPTVRLHAVARDRDALATLAAARPDTSVHVADLSDLDDAARVGRALADTVTNGATLVHNAGLWPDRLERVNGLERAFVVNCLGPLALQAPLLEDERLARVLVVGAGLMVKGRFDAEKTPRGDDFSWWRTYASTKLAFATAMRDVAHEHPSVDVAVMHPGLARTELGARSGLLGWLVRLAKRRWESPEQCAERIVWLIARPRWSPAGEARWFVPSRGSRGTLEVEEQPWPREVDDAVSAVRVALHA